MTSLYNELIIENNYVTILPNISDKLGFKIKTQIASAS